MYRSVSEPSLGTIGNITIATDSTRASHLNIPTSIKPGHFYKGQWFWEGRRADITRRIALAPWNIWWQTLVILTVIFKYICHFLLGYYLDNSWDFLDVSILLAEVIFIVDLFVHLLHTFWPILRLHIRIYKRSYILLTYDVITLLPLTIVFRYQKDYKIYLMIGRWLGICRIYRIFGYFQVLNVAMHTARKKLYVLEHLVMVVLILHGSTCLFFSLNKSPLTYLKKWYSLGYPAHVNTQKLQFDDYTSSWYYCSCRLFNIIFGDAFPLLPLEKWLTSFLMLVGFVLVRYRFIGIIAWELILQDGRWAAFVEQYHHMIEYLKFRGAPVALIQQAKQYKEHLWSMKDGVLTSEHLHELPLPLQMELIFDINVGHFHDTLLFKDACKYIDRNFITYDKFTERILMYRKKDTFRHLNRLQKSKDLKDFVDAEAFMRHTSLLMRHELFLEGQPIWNQGVVKSGMICVKRGVLEMLSDEDDESPVIAFKEGTVLGEISLFYSIPAKVTVKAATYVELQVLRRTDFMRAMVENPSMLQQIRKKVEIRLKTSKTKQEAIVKYDSNDSRLLRTRYRPMKILKDYLAGVEEEDPTFIDDSHMYYKDENNIRQRKFTTDYLELYHMSENVTTVEAPRMCLRSNFPWILEPNTSFTYTFDVVHFITILYVCFVTPHVAIESIRSDWDTVFGIITTASLLLNVYIQLTTAIVEKNVRKETVREIAEEKMASLGFYLDIISVSPVYIFLDTLDPSGKSLLSQLVVVIPVLQVWHIWDYFNKWERNFNSNRKILCLIKYCLLFLICCYWFGCLLYIYACPRKRCQENSWMAKLIYWETKVFVTNAAMHERPSISSLSFGTAVFTGTGMSDLAPGRADLLLVVFLFALGAYLNCFYVAKVCSLYLLSTRRKLKFKESMRELFYFLSVNHVSGRIKARVKKFFCVQWYYNKAVSNEEIFKDMSANIQQEILSIEMVETLLLSPLFQECSRDFLQTVAANTRTIVLPDNEVVQHAADIGRDMYIVQKGHCHKLNQNGKVVGSLKSGGYFGDFEMLYGLPKVYTVVTSTNCVLLHVEYSALVQCWGTFPDISHPIIATLRDSEIRRQASRFDDANPLSGRIDAKTNRIAQEIKESFVVLNGRDERSQYIKAFNKLGVMRYLRYLFLPGCITPHGIFLKLWCALRLVTAIYYVLVIPYNIATNQHKHYSGTRFNWLDTVLFFDLWLMCYVAYYNERSLLVTHPLLTLTQYLKHGFLLDILSVFPFEELFKIVNDRSDSDLYRANRILLITRITGAFNYWESDIMRVNQIVVLLKFIPIAVTLVNFATALIFMKSCESYTTSEYYYILVNCSKVLVLNNSRDENKYAVSEYVRNFYWVFEIFVGCGCTPVVVANTVDTWLMMTLQIAGVLYFAFMFGYVASTRSATAHALLDHNEKTKDLANFLYQENVDPVLTVKTLKYFEYVWKRTNGSNPQQICRGLNSALMEDTLVFMYEKALREVPLFGKVERSFIRVITQHLHEMYFLKGDTVIQCKDVQTNVYIIYRGKVDVLSSYSEMITCMGPGGMFGNFTGQPMSCSEVSIYASRSLDLLVLPCQTFLNLVKFYPKIQEPLYKAFEISKDYILPISMDAMSDTESSEDSDLDILSQDSAFESRSGSIRYEIPGPISTRTSQSNVSSAKSSASVLTYQSMTIANLFRPGSRVYQGFGYFTCFMATVSYVLTLYQMVTLNDCFILFWLQSFLDIFFYLKNYQTMHQGYINRHGELIMISAKCRRRYFKHKLWFWTDLLVGLPLELFGFCFTKPQTAMHYLRANKLFRLKYLLEFYRKTSAELTNNLTILQTVMAVFVVVIFIHTFTCIWLLTLIAISPFSIIRTLKMHLVDEDTPQRQWDYTTSFYVVVCVLTGTGSDEYIVVEVFSMVILAICLICGKMLAAIIVATSIQVAYSSKYALTTYETATKKLIDVLKNQGLSNYQLDKFWKYVQQLWLTERGRQLPTLLRRTPYVLRCDLMSSMFGNHLRNCFLFADTGEPFLRQLSVLLEYTIFFPGNYIVVAGDSEARMHWVASGTVSVVSVRSDLTEITHELLETGDVFGILQGLNRGVQHCFSYRAETKVSILTLNLDAWSNILPFFPEAKAIISERAEHLFTQI